MLTKPPEPKPCKHCGSLWCGSYRCRFLMRAQAMGVAFRKEYGNGRRY